MTIQNRKIHYDYEILEEYECGIMLTGSEVKSIRHGRCNINDSYAYVSNNDEVFLKNSFVSSWDSDKFTNHDERRDRKLLMHKVEIRKIKKSLQVTGISLVPKSIYMSNNKFKVNLCVCKGKKKYDKREDIKKRDLERESQMKF